MKRFIGLTVLAMMAVIVCLAVAVASWAGPFLVADPYTYTGTGTLYFKIMGLPGSPITVQPDPTKTYAFHYDLVALPPGSYTATAMACVNDPMWGGEVCSDSSNPLSLTRPSGPTTLPTNLKLSIQ